MPLPPIHCGWRPSRRGAVGLPELILVVSLILFLTGLSFTVYFNSFKGNALRNEAMKFRQLQATARSLAIARNAPHQVTYWSGGPSIWIDEIDSAGSVVRSKITTPEFLEDGIAVKGFVGGVAHEETATYSIRCFPDGTSDNASVYLSRTDTDPNDPTAYYTVKVYGPTARAAIFENQVRN